MKGICLIVWMLLSLVLVCSVIGLLLFVPKDRYDSKSNEPSTWATVGRKLLDAVIAN
jgi:hypothetical protein